MADAQWVLDIAANMPAGQATTAELDRLTEALTGAGRKSDEFQSALKVVSGQLDVAKASSVAANAALAAGSEQYKLLEREAIRAGKALEVAQAKGKPDMRAALEAHRASEALNAQAEALAGLEGAAKSAGAEQDKYAKQLANVEKIGKHVDERNQRAAQRYGRIAEAAGLLPGPLGRIVGTAARAGKASEELGSTFGTTTARTLLLVAGIGILAVGLVALTAATIGGVVAFGLFGAKTADAARSAGLAREAFAALSGETASAVGSFDAVAAATGLGDAELVSLTKQLRAAEVAAGDMPKALMAAATAEAALGSGGAGEFIQRIHAGELAVQDFANEAQAAFGGVVAKQLRGLDAQGKRLSKNFAALFANVNLDPILDAVEIFVGMFDKANPLAQAFGFGVEKGFGLIADAAVSTAYAIEAFALDVAIAAVKAYLFFRKYGEEIGNTLIGVGVALAGVGLAWAVFNAGAIAGFAATAASAVVAGATVAASWLVAAAPAIAVIAAIAAVGYAIGQLLTHWDEVVEGVKLIWSDLTSWLGERATEMVAIGRNLLMGLVEGVTGAVGAVVQAVSGAVGSAITAAKDVLGIASPSKVFAEIGDQTAQGYSLGVEQGTPEAQGSMARMVSPTDAATTAPAEAAQSGAAAGGGRGSSINLQGATFVFHGVADAETARDRFAEMFTTLLEGDADSLSGMTEAPV
ncbi:MAG TPA: hypothetical protein VGK73_33975 [Polyangiaceae bacterium]